MGKKKFSVIPLKGSCLATGTDRLLFWEMQAVWDTLLANISPFHLFVTTTLAIHLVVYWSLCLSYMYLDLTKSPAFLYKYKIQKTKSVTWQEYKKLIKQAFISQAIAYLVGFGVYILSVGFGFGINIDPTLPSGWRIFFHLLGFVAVEEVGFYYSHYAFHSKYLYARFHKIHHEFKAPVAMACIYAHPIEHLVANLLPLVLGPVLFQAHLVELWLWLTIGIVNTIKSHSGYELPWTTEAAGHDYHHEAFNYNYGAVGIMDYLHGTKAKRPSGKK